MDKASEELLASLTCMHAALLSGDFAAMAGLTERLERQLTRGLITTDPVMLRDLRKKSAENAVLLRSAQRGLRAAQRRIAEIRGVSAGLTTYSADGQRTYSAHRGGPDHRA
jgi:hypothetical protein